MRRKQQIACAIISVVVVGLALVFSLSGGVPGVASWMGDGAPTEVELEQRMSRARERHERATGARERAEALDAVAALAQDAMQHRWAGRRNAVLGAVQMLGSESRVAEAQALIEALWEDPERPPDKLGCLAAKARLAAGAGQLEAASERYWAMYDEFARLPMEYREPGSMELAMAANELFRVEVSRGRFREAARSQEIVFGEVCRRIDPGMAWGARMNRIVALQRGAELGQVPLGEVGVALDEARVADPGRWAAQPELASVQAQYQLSSREFESALGSATTGLDSTSEVGTRLALWEARWRALSGLGRPREGVDSLMSGLAEIDALGEEDRRRYADRERSFLSALSSADSFERADAAVYAIQRLLARASHPNDVASLQIQLDRAVARLERVR